MGVGQMNRFNSYHDNGNRNFMGRGGKRDDYNNGPRDQDSMPNRDDDRPQYFGQLKCYNC